jgi:hypothetical protein
MYIYLSIHTTSTLNFHSIRVVLCIHITVQVGRNTNHWDLYLDILRKAALRTTIGALLTDPDGVVSQLVGARLPAWFATNRRILEKLTPGQRHTGTCIYT